MSYFARKEFACKCGCGFDTVDFETRNVCDEVRQFEGAPVVVNSGCRCEAYNSLVGGVKDSQHKFARAADLRVSSPLATYSYLCRIYPDKYGFGLYDTFVHVDTRTGSPVRWDKRSK